MARFFSDLKSTWTIAHENSEDETFRFKQLKYFLPYVRAHKIKLISGILLITIVSLLTLPIPYLSKILIDDVFPNKDFFKLHIITLIILVLYLLKVIASFLMNYLFSILNQEIQVAVRENLFHRLLRLPLSFFNKQQSGYLLSRLREVQGLNAFFSTSVIGLFASFLEFVFILKILLLFSWKMTFIALLILPAYFFTIKKFSSGLRTSSRNLMEKTAQLSKNIQESLYGINVIKVFGAEERETKKIHQSLIDYFKSGILQSIFFSLSSEIIFLIGALGSLAILWFSGVEIMRGDFTVGMYVAFSGYLAKLYGPTQQFASVGVTLQPAMTALSRISELLKLIAEDEVSGRVRSVPMLGGEIVFDDVTFAYEGQNAALKRISFQINPGKKVALVGPSGAGKTTLVSLLLQLYQPNKGKIYFDSIDAQTIRLKDLRERIGFVSQDAFLFDDSIKNNIRYGKPDASDDEVLKASKMAYAHDFIQELPSGYNTIVGDLPNPFRKTAAKAVFSKAVDRIKMVR